MRTADSVYYSGSGPEENRNMLSWHLICRYHHKNRFVVFLWRQALRIPRYVQNENKKNTPGQVEVNPDMLPSQFKTQYFQCLLENENIYGMTSCPSGKTAEIKGRIGSLILLGHEKEVIYMLI